MTPTAVERCRVKAESLAFKGVETEAIVEVVHVVVIDTGVLFPRKVHRAVRVLCRTTVVHVQPHFDGHFIQCCSQPNSSRHSVTVARLFASKHDRIGAVNRCFGHAAARCGDIGCGGQRSLVGPRRAVVRVVARP